MSFMRDSFEKKKAITFRMVLSRIFIAMCLFFLLLSGFFILELIMSGNAAGGEVAMVAPIKGHPCS